MPAKIPADVREQQINELPDITFVRWESEYRNNQSKAVCRCRANHEWSARLNDLLSIGSRCPSCAGNRRWSAEERIGQINELPQICFVRWGSGYRNNQSKAVCRCIANHEWSASVNDLLRGKGCPQCAGNIRWTAEDRIEQINALQNIRFVKWSGIYKNNQSKAVIRCSANHEWTTTVNNLLSGKGCPSCAKTGFNPAIPATLYILRSECGAMVKIGISNDHKRRLTELRNVTPFNWSCIEMLHNEDGSLIAEWEKELHSWTEQAAFKATFQGYTEWRKWDDRLPRWIERYRARLARIAAGVAR